MRHINGMSFLETLTLIFLVLKLSNLVSWSWWWVFSPMLIVIALAAIIFILSVVIGLIAELLE